MEVADRIVVMNEGRIEQQGPPDEVYDHPSSPFVLQFLGDVNLFHGRLDHGVGAPESAPAEVSYVRPHELQIVGSAVTGSVEVSLSQALTVGPNTRVEFRRASDGSYIDVELPRAEYVALRNKLGLGPGAKAYLLPRNVTRFSEDQADPAALI